MSDISVIVITRNRCQLLCQALERIRALLPHAELIVIDNASTDNTPEHVRQRFPEAKLISLAENVGIPGARNLGARHAHGTLLLFLDDDGYLQCPQLPQLMEAFRAQSEWAVITFPLSPSEGGTSLQEWYTFYGGAALVKKDPFWAVGGFPEHFFYSHEEDDLSLRLFARGYRIAVCPWAHFVHLKAERGDSWHRVYYYYRNRQWVIWRHLPLGWALLESLATLVGGLARTALSPYLGAFFAGSLAAFMRLPTILRKERRPLDYAQYAWYRTLSAGGANPLVRLKKLWRDVRQGDQLSRIK